MAYVGNCAKHGSYLNWCHDCQQEKLAVDVVASIKAGANPDFALETILSESRESKQQRENEREREKLEEQVKAIARAEWIERNLPAELRPKGTSFG